MYDKTLDTFKSVADSGSFTKASEQLYISHTAIMKQMNRLEAHLGVKLFRRSNQGAVLTSAGQCLYRKTEEIMQFSEKAIQEIQEVHFASPQTIRIGASMFYPCHIFMDLWESISDNRPQYKLKIVPIENDEQRFSGLDKVYDFLVGPYNSEISRAVYPFIPVGKYHFCIAMPRKHPLSKKKILSFNDLSGNRLMIMKRGNSEVNDQIRTEIEDRYPGIKLIDIPPHYSIHTFNQCVESNSMLLSLECWKEVHPGLITIPLTGDYSLPYGILTSKNPTADISEFVTYLQNYLRHSD